MAKVIVKRADPPEPEPEWNMLLDWPTEEEAEAARIAGEERARVENDEAEQKAVEAVAARQVAAEDAARQEAEAIKAAEEMAGKAELEQKSVAQEAESKAMKEKSAVPETVGEAKHEDKSAVPGVDGEAKQVHSVAQEAEPDVALVKKLILEVTTLTIYLAALSCAASTAAVLWCGCARARESVLPSHDLTHNRFLFEPQPTGLRWCDPSWAGHTKQKQRIERAIVRLLLHYHFDLSDQPLNNLPPQTLKDSLHDHFCQGEALAQVPGAGERSPTVGMATPPSGFSFHRTTLHVGGLTTALAADEALRQLFMPYCLCVQVTLRLKAEEEYGSCKSWALVTVPTPELAAEVMGVMLLTAEGTQITMELVDMNKGLGSIGSFLKVPHS